MYRLYREREHYHASWLLVTPSPGLDLHLDPNELQISIQWWLGIDTARGSSCSLCPGLALDRLGSHATTCKRGGDVVTRHNHLCNVIVEFCHCAHLGVRVELGSGITPDLSRTRPADVLVLNWERGKHAALDITVTSPLIPSILTAASLSEGAAAEEAEVRKHRANDPKCSELGWVCIPFAVETYGNWGREAQSTFSQNALDPDCHHALTCRSGGDVIARHNKLRDCVANLCSKACLSPQLEKGPGIDFSRPADVLVPNWSLSNPAAFDLKVIHPLNTDLILEASLASGNSAEVGEIEKHAKNDQMCARLGWTCIPLVVEVYGGWGCEAKECYSRLSKRLAMQVGICETEALCQMYCLLAVTLMRQNARAILLRCARAPLLEYSH
ncbi:hypothetical protein EMCRGX_G022456 [Ephydatia muelleri]